MGVPTINTSTWRLPKRGHSSPEKTFTDEMYRAKGLPVAPTPTTGGSGLPVLDTSEWRLPPKGAALTEGKKRQPHKSFEVELSDEEFDDLGDDYDPSDFSDLESDYDGDMDEMCGASHGKKKRKRKGQPPMAEAGCAGGKKGKKSYLVKRKGAGMPEEDTRSVQRRLAGLEMDEHLEFATGAPHRRLPEQAEAPFRPERREPLFEDNRQNALPSEQAALAGLTERAPLPHPMHDTRPLSTPRAHGVLDDGKDSGEAYVEQVLAESRWFFRDFGDLAIGERPFGEAPGGRAGPWRGSEDEPAETPVVRHGKVKGAVGDEPEDDDEDEKKQPPPAKGKPKAPPEEEEPEEEPEGDEEDEDEEEETSEAKRPKMLKPAYMDMLMTLPIKVGQQPNRARGQKTKAQMFSKLFKSGYIALKKGGGTYILTPKGEKMVALWMAHPPMIEAEETRAGRAARGLGGRLKAAGERMRSGSAASRAKHGLHVHLRKFAKKHGIDIEKHFHGSDEDGKTKPHVPKAPKKKAKAKPTHAAPTKRHSGPLTKHAPVLHGPQMKKHK